MKKLIFLFLIMAVALVGMVSAQGVANEPGVITLDALMSEYGVDNLAVASDTVLAASPLSVALPVGILAVPDNMNITGQPQYFTIKPINTGQGMGAVIKEPDYWLRP